MFTAKQHPMIRAAHYLFLLPFLPALRPILINFDPLDLSIYLMGMLLISFLIILSNNRPLIQVEDDQFLIWLHYRHGSEIHPYNEIDSYHRLSASRVAVHSKGHHPVALTLARADIDRIIQTFEEKGLHETEAKKKD